MSYSSDGSARERGPLSDPASPSLHERQSLMVKCLGELFRYASQQGYDLTLAEGFVQYERRTADGQLIRDGVHMVGSLHYVRLAQDINLFEKGQFITSASDPTWVDLGTFWMALDPLCRWGGTFTGKSAGDVGHFSIAWDGRA